MSKRLILWLILAMAAGCQDAPPDSERVRVTVPRGATLTEVAETLSARGIIGSPTLFRLYATASGKQRGIQAGTYEFPTNASMRHALDILVSGREVLEQLVLPEGLMLSEVAERVRAQLGIEPDSFVAAASDATIRARLNLTAPTLEGYLYPSTYYVRVGVTARELVEQMVTEFEARWQPEWAARLDQLGMTRHDVVILASIIEGEVRYGPDRTYVSSVYHNRLERGMRLQADPTVIYALGTRRRLYEKDYQFPSPYNTYLIDGLPPGPIGQPSEASLQAALWPKRTDFLFFVARPDGKHVFSRTLRQHRAAVRQVRQWEARLRQR